METTAIILSCLFTFVVGMIFGSWYIRSLHEPVTKCDLYEMEERIMTALEELETEVKENSDVIDSAVTLIKGLAQLVKDAGTDPVKLRNLVTLLDTKAKELAQVVVENTPAAEEPPQEPTT